MRRKVKIRNNVEGEVYRCSWQKKDQHYTLRCSDPVKVAVRSVDLEDAMDKLISKIMTLTGDGEPCFQFVPDLPEAGDQQSYFNPKYYEIGYNCSAEWLSSSGKTEDLTANGQCKKCRLGLGSRTNVRRVITTVPRYDISGFYKDRTLGMMMSEGVLKHLMPYMKRRVELIPVDVDSKISKRLRKRFFELSFGPDTSVAIPREYDSLSGWRCKACGTFMVFWHNPRIAKSSTDGIARSSLVKPVVFVQTGPRKSIVVNKTVHDALCSDKVIRGLVLEPVAIFSQRQMLSPEEVKKLKLPQIEP